MDSVTGIGSDEVSSEGYQRLIRSPPARRPVSSVHAANAVCRAPIAMVALFDEDTEWLVARQGIDAERLPRGHGFGDHTLRCAGGRCVVRDAAKDARFARLPLVTAAPHVRSYAAA